MKACVLIRDLPPYRRNSFVAGLKVCGYEVIDNEDTSSPDNILVIWNRYRHYDMVAKRYEAKNLKVLVAENGYLGRDWRGEHWYALARGAHNGAGSWHEGGPERWDNLKVDIAPWRTTGKEIVILATRSIGVPGVAESVGWSRQMAERLSKNAAVPVRIRPHPGENKARDLEEDLKDALYVVSWGSGAALKALLWGIPTMHGFKRWIGAPCSTGIDSHLNMSAQRYYDRLAMFRRLAWAMWNTEEIATGEPFKCLLA